jgi:hypothetical protein
MIMTDFIPPDGFEYLPSCSRVPPWPGDGPRVLVHNHVYPAARRQGTRGSRFWLQPLDDRLERCPFAWSNWPVHYRVVRAHE